MKHVIANWKMYLGEPSAEALMLELVAHVENQEDTPNVVVCVPDIELEHMAKIVSGSKIQLGAQDVFWANEGAHTGSTGPAALVNAGCTYAIVGHSERRGELAETNEMIAKKLRAGAGEELHVILCVGEAREVRDAGEHKAFIKKQLSDVLEGFEHPQRLLVAYEPLWAISDAGSGTGASIEDVKEMCECIREELLRMFEDVGVFVPILYGGSVSAENAASYLGQDYIDGALIGSASTKYDAFTKIIEAAI